MRGQRRDRPAKKDGEERQSTHCNPAAQARIRRALAERQANVAP
jgi:hypothetical protein